MKVTVYIVDRFTLKKTRKVQSYGDTHIALSRCATLLSELDGSMIYMENIKWSEYGVKTECILLYDEAFSFGFIITNSGLQKNKMGPFPLKKKGPIEKDEDSE
tara:strand:- start:139 stop:447 length:309 start_codon:yes stop_codon:yes gene_type:complete